MTNDIFERTIDDQLLNQAMQLEVKLLSVLDQQKPGIVTSNSGPSDIHNVKINALMLTLAAELLGSGLPEDAESQVCAALGELLKDILRDGRQHLTKVAQHEATLAVKH